MLSGDLRQNHVGVGTRLAGVVQGYRPQVDWGGDSGSATIVVGGHNVRVATSGWRRRCLYMLLLALLALSVLNLSLTLWILKTVYFNVDGMGHLNVVTGGLEMQGATEFSKKLTVASMLSKKNQDLPINGYYNLTIFTTHYNASAAEEQFVNDTNGDPSLITHPTVLHINVDDVLVGAQEFRVRGNDDKELFSATIDGTKVGAETFTVTGIGGAVVEGSMQTPRLYSKDVHELRLESITRDVKARGTEELRVEARNGDISSICTGNAALVSKEGAIRFENRHIYLPKLDIQGEEEFQKMIATGDDDDEDDDDDISVTPTPSPQETQIPPPPTVATFNEGTTTPMPPGEEEGEEEEKLKDAGESASDDVQVFQVCVCPSGKLFVVGAAYACVTDDKVCR